MNKILKKEDLLPVYLLLVVCLYIFKTCYSTQQIDARIHQVNHENGIQDNEHHHVFIAELKTPISELTMQPEEVAGLELWDLKVLKETKNLENVLLPRFHEYYVNVYNKIISHLK